MRRTKRRITNFVAVLLGGIMSFACVSLKGENKTPEVTASVRTVELSVLPQYEKYLTSFEEKAVSCEGDEEVAFNGTMKYNKDALTIFDNVSLLNEVDEEKSEIKYNCSFNMESMQFTFTASVTDENGGEIEIEKLVTDAFVTETGGLDAYLELDGETYLLSEYYSTDAIDECGLFLGILFGIGIAIISYVIVAETAEQVKAKTNYRDNKELERRGNGVGLGNYITNQTETKKVGYKSGEYKFGFTSFSGVGCEVASVYNLLIAKNRAERLSETIFSFEKWAIEFCTGWGRLGSNPKDINRFLRKRGISYTKYVNYNGFKSALDKKGSCHVIMANWNNGGAVNSIFTGAGLHTYYIKKINNNEFYGYNIQQKDKYVRYDSIKDIFSDKHGKFIVAYIID